MRSLQGTQRSSSLESTSPMISRPGFALALCLALTPAFAAETTPEKAKVIKNDAGRGVKKGAHRVEEAVCMKSDAACLAEKAKHRTGEAVEATGDKASELKNKADGE